MNVTPPWNWRRASSQPIRRSTRGRGYSSPRGWWIRTQHPRWWRLFAHKFGEESDWILEVPETSAGTTILMKLNNHSSRTDKQVFAEYTSGDDFGFTKTVVPVRLAQYGEDKLISRSQAKRLLARVDLFRSVLFDFEGVETIGQAFADEIFRVFARSHPNIDLIPISATPQIQQMINAARAQWAADLGGI